MMKSLFTLLNSKGLIAVVRKGYLSCQYVPKPMVSSNLSVLFSCNLWDRQKLQKQVSSFDPNLPLNVERVLVISVILVRPCSASYCEHLPRQCAVRRMRTSSWTKGAAQPNCGDWLKTVWLMIEFFEMQLKKRGLTHMSVIVDGEGWSGQKDDSSVKVDEVLWLRGKE